MQIQIDITQNTNTNTNIIQIQRINFCYCVSTPIAAPSLSQQTCFASQFTIHCLPCLDKQEHPQSCLGGKGQNTALWSMDQAMKMASSSALWVI